MRRSLHLLAWMFGVLLLLVVALVVFVALFNWNRLKPYIEHQVSAETGRPFVIEGDLTAAWHWESSEPFWRRWVPWPTFTARDIHMGNPPWTKQPQFAQVDTLQLRLSPLPLLVQHVYIPSIQFEGLRIDLERDSQGRANWAFHFQQGAPSSWRVTLGTIGLNKSDIALDDAKTKLTLHIVVAPLQKGIPYNQLVQQATHESRKDVGHDVGKDVVASQTTPDTSANAERTQYRFAWTASGSYRGVPVDGTGKTGAVLALRQADRPFPVQARVHIGQSEIALVGTLTDPMHLGALNLRVWFAGASMSKLYPILGVTLPATPPFATEGHLSAELHKQGSRFTYRNFKGRVGESQLAGNVQVVTGGARPKLSGDLHSSMLRFADLAPLVGADKPAEKRKRGDTTPQPANKALPVEQFHSHRLLAMDADVTFDAAHIEHPGSVPIDSLDTHIYLDDGVLKLNPLHMGVAGGFVDGRIRMDGKADPMRTALDLRARHLHLKQLFPNVQSMQTSFGEINGDVTLHGSGGSVSTLLSHADGELKLLMNEGAVNKTLLEAAGLNVANVVIEKLFGSQTIKINCAATDLAGTNGLFTSRFFLLDTTDATVNVRGTINFANEHLNLEIAPHTKGLRVLSLRSPLYVKGTFKHPDVGVQPGPLLLRSGGAVALGIVAAPVAALLAVIVPSHGQHPNACQRVLTKLRNEPAVPPSEGVQPKGQTQE